MPLPLAFVLLPTTLSSPALTPLLSVQLNRVTIYRTLDPEPGEPFVSSSLLLLSQSLPPILALTQYGCRLPLGYDTSLSGLAPFPDIWIPLSTARDIAKDLDILEPLAFLLSWKTRAMSSWFEGTGEDGGGVVAHNWRLPEDRASSSKYSHETLVSSNITSNIALLPPHQTILTLISPTELAALLSPSSPASLASLPATPLSDLWPSLVLLTTESFETYISSSDSTLPSSSTVLANLAHPFLHLLGSESTFPSVDKEELVKLLGGRRGRGEEGRKAWIRGVEVLGGLMVGLIMGRVRWDQGKAKGIEVVLPLQDETEQSREHSRKSEVGQSSELRRNGKDPSRERSPSSNSTRRPLPTPSPPPPTPTPPPPSISSSQITSQLSTLIAQIDHLSTQIETRANHPNPPPLMSNSSLGSFPSPQIGPTPSAPNPWFRPLWILLLSLLFASNLLWAGAFLRSSASRVEIATPNPLPSSPPPPPSVLPSVEENRAWLLTYVADHHDSDEF